jgi:hypothetical protein
MKRIAAITAMLALVGCSNTSLVVSINVIAIAASAAVPFAGQYAPFVLAAAEGAGACATELTTIHPAAEQYSKILDILTGVVNKYPNIDNASPETKLKILAIEAAINAAIRMIRVQVGQAATMVKGAFADGPSIPINKSDAAKLVETIKISEQTEKALRK